MLSGIEYIILFKNMLNPFIAIHKINLSLLMNP